MGFNVSLFVCGASLAQCHLPSWFVLLFKVKLSTSRVVLYLINYTET